MLHFSEIYNSTPSVETSGAKPCQTLQNQIFIMMCEEKETGLKTKRLLLFPPSSNGCARKTQSIKDKMKSSSQSLPLALGNDLFGRRTWKELEEPCLERNGPAQRFARGGCWVSISPLDLTISLELF
jgi:hypothetical protein